MFHFGSNFWTKCRFYFTCTALMTAFFSFIFVVMLVDEIRIFEKKQEDIITCIEDLNLPPGVFAGNLEQHFAELEARKAQDEKQRFLVKAEMTPTIKTTTTAAGEPTTTTTTTTTTKTATKQTRALVAASTTYATGYFSKIQADAVIKNVTSPTNSTPTALSSDYEVNNTINVSITTILVPSSRYIDISPTSATNALTTVFYGNVHKNDTSDNSTLLTIPYSATAMVHSRPAASTLIESLNGTTMDTNSTSAMSTSIRVSPSIAKSSNLVITLTASSSIAISTKKPVYKVSYETATWHEAQARCQNGGGNLASITGFEEMVLAKTALTSSNTTITKAWVGLNDLEEENNFVWIDGTPASPLRWGIWEPNTGRTTNEDCVEVFVDTMELRDALCDKSLYFVCKIQQSNINGTIDSNTTTSIEYKVLTIGLVWDKAREHCKGIGGDLASILSREEKSLFLAAVAPLNPINWIVWVGLNDKELEDTFKWSDGTIPAPLRWQTWEPNDYGGSEDCSIVETVSMRLNDLNCNDKHYYLCKNIP